jgi:hypothetical protein
MKNVAVITVHGVADHQPNVTSRQIADLLVRHEPSAGAFYETDVRIVVDPVVVPQISKEKLWSQDAGFTFMYGQLTGDLACDGRHRVTPLPRETFDGTCLSGVTPDGTFVHIYEMYWADLSRLSSSFRRIFGEFYQLLFHVSSLGRHTVDEARDDAKMATEEAARDDAKTPMDEAERALEQSRTWRARNVPPLHGNWRWLAGAQRAAGHVLTLPIPILNLYLLAVAATLGISWVPAKQQHWIGAALLGLGALLAVGFAFYRSALPARRYWVAFSLAAAAALALGFIAAMLVPQTGPISPTFLAVWCIALAVILFVLLRAYDRRRFGALRWGGILAIVVIGFGIYFCTKPEVGRDLDRMFLHTIEAICLLLFVFWGILLLCHWAVTGAGSILKWRARQIAKRALAGSVAQRYRDKVRRVVWTGRLAVLLPTALFVNVTLALWAGVAYIADKLRPASHALWYQPYPSFQCLYESHSANYDSVTDIGLDLLAAAASPLAALSLVTMASAVVLALWAFFPVVLAEVKPPRAIPNGARLGEWLDGGLKLLRWSGRLFFISVVVLLPFGLILSVLDCADVHPAAELMKWIDPAGWGLPQSRNIMAAIGAALAGTTVALLAFSGRLAKIARRIRPILDVALDVDNHLREQPPGNNPRARIAARYVSLLRHLCGWRGMNGEAYDALIIVAHSQGTVITADLLRFIRTLSVLESRARQPFDPQLARIDANAGGRDKLPIYLLTVGCPLRQLYSLRFPDMYDWARHSEAGPWDLAEGKIPSNQVIAHGPDPRELNVERWVNAYRSGDYVGRYLWRPDLCDYRWDGRGEMRSTSATGDRVEFCIGAGAHTHYFDETAPEIGREIAALIEYAARP